MVRKLCVDWVRFLRELGRNFCGEHQQQFQQGPVIADRHHAFRIMHIMLNAVRYYWTLLKLALERLLRQPGSPKDSGSFDACRTL